MAVDPLFVNVASGDYHLAAGSPLIDAGDDTYVNTGDTDLDGYTRIQGSHVDIGAYETSATKITSLSPNTVQAGRYGFTLTVNGTGFVSGATVYWKGMALTTTTSPLRN